MMVSVGCGRASRGLTAIPVHAAAGRNRGVLDATAQRSAGRDKRVSWPARNDGPLRGPAGEETRLTR